MFGDERRERVSACVRFGLPWLHLHVVVCTKRHERDEHGNRDLGQFCRAHADWVVNGTPTALVNSQADTDEVYSIDAPNTGRYAVTAHTVIGDLITRWDGTHAYRYLPQFHEIYCPQPENENAYWSDDTDEYAFLGYLHPQYL